MNKTMVNDLTSGSVAKKLITFALPLFLSNALQAIYNIVDMIVVGQYHGGPGMSAVSTGGDILHLLTFLAMGFSAAGQVLISQDVGANRMESVKKTIGTMFTFLMGASIVLSVVCFILREPILNWLNTPSEAYQYTLDYTVTCIFGLFFIYGYNIVSAILRGMGDSKRPFVFIMIAAILNIILDIVFVAFLGMEVFGAALATVIGQGVSFIVSIIYLYRKRESFGFDFKLRSFIPERKALSRLLLLGVPMAIQSAAISISKIIIMAWINDAGLIYSALAGVYNKINVMVNVVANSFTTAGSAMVGQNLGAGKTDRVPKVMLTVAVCSGILTAVFTALMLLFPTPIYNAFTTDADVIGIASMITIPIILNFFGAATRSISFSLINGSGNTNLNLAVAIIDGVISRIGLSALLGFGFNMSCLGFWYGDSIAGFMPIIIGMCYFLSGRWRKPKESTKSAEDN